MIRTITQWAGRPMADTTVKVSQCRMTHRTLSCHVPDFLVARAYRPASARQRGSLLERFCDLTDDPPAAQLTAPLVLIWWSALAGLAAPTRQAHLSAVRGFCAHLRAVGALDGDPTSAIARPRNRRRPPVTMTPGEVVALLRSLPTSRDRAMVSLMLGCGLRAMEVSALNIEDIDIDRRMLEVVGKGDRHRAAPIPTATVECIDDYLNERPADRGPLIRHYANEARLAPEPVQQRVTRLLYRAGVKRGPGDGRSSHVLRRTCATQLLESGASIRDVQLVLGHENLSSTEHYLARPDDARLAALIENGPLGAA